MTRMLTSGLAAAAMLFALGASAPAHADTVVGVKLAPRVGVGVRVDTRAAPVRVVHRPARPGPNYHWVEGHWRVQRPGHRVWVPGHWQRDRVVTRQVVVVR